ncbi:MAG: hypothetical protein M1823_001161 [Watsoniomyces obsoletus]|nr:MAG: hypothetical protein M1823_001161 [Watsoniomyces obsoletus]
MAALNFTSAHSSRIQKSPKKKTPSISSRVTKSSHGPPKRRPSGHDELTNDIHLPDTGIPLALIPDRSFDDDGIVEAIHFIQSSMFNDIPERASGMNSTRISTVLNFRAALPPVVSASHVHVLFNAPSKTEKEISRLMKDGVIRRITISGRRGKGVGSGQMLILLDDWQRRVNKSSGLSDRVKQTYNDLLKSHSGSVDTETLRASLSAEEVKELVHLGFLTMPHGSLPTLSGGINSSATVPSLLKAGSQEASGSLGAVGGINAFLNAGGGGSHLHRQPTSNSIEAPSPLKTGVSGTNFIKQDNVQYDFSLPAMGSYLNLSNSARTHFMSLLAKSKFKEATMDILRQRWNGGIVNDSAISQAKKLRGEFAGVLPGRTRKWKDFWGLAFDWILGECVAAGLVEIFETGTVGRAVRAR